MTKSLHIRNSGYGTIASPGNDPLVITVGAVNDRGDGNRANDVIATYSSKGPTAIDHVVKPDLVAPGNRIISYQANKAELEKAHPENAPAKSEYLRNGNRDASPDFFRLSGTSMAAPAVSGIAALLIQKDPSLTPDQVKAKLMKTAWRGFPPTASTYDPATMTTYSANHDIFTIGAGMVDGWSAFNNADKTAAPAESPVAYYDPATRKVRLALAGTSLVWGTTAPFATSLVWGSSVSGSTLVWGTSIVWGTDVMQGFSVVWGTTSPWANSVPSGENVRIAIDGEN